MKKLVVVEIIIAVVLAMLILFLSAYKNREEPKAPEVTNHTSGSPENAGNTGFADETNNSVIPNPTVPTDSTAVTEAESGSVAETKDPTKPAHETTQEETTVENVENTETEPEETIEQSPTETTINLEDIELGENELPIS